jgi:glycosyltransferase involved in cell wall biosynthesis
MLNLLVLSFFPAFTPPKSGGEQRLFSLYRQVSSTCAVTLLSSSHPGEGEEVVHHTSNFKERRISKDDSFHKSWMTLASAQQDGDISGPCVGLSGKYATPFHLAFLEEYPKADIIIHESPFTVHYDPFMGFDDKLRVYNSHNVESHLYGQMHQASPAGSVRDLVLNLERRLLKHTDLLCYCSDADRELFEEAFGLPQNTLLLPNGFSPIRSIIRPKAAIEKAVFLGSAHKPNLLAAEHILKNIAPRLSDLDFHFVGECLPAGSYAPNVVRHGHVDAVTKQRILDSADVSLNPMEIGSGSSLKVLEYFEAGLPLFSTDFGVRGFDVTPNCDFVRATIAEFADILGTWRSDVAGLNRIAANARNLALEKYSWSSIARVFVENLQDLWARRQPQQKRLVVALNDYASFRSAGGGARRSQGLYRELSTDFRVAYLSFANDDTLSAEMISDDILEVVVPKSQSHLDKQAQVDSSHHVSAADIIAAEFALHNLHLRRLYECLRSEASIVVIEHPYMVKLPASYSDRFIYSSHNHELQLKRQSLQHHPSAAMLLDCLHDIEDIAISASATVIAVSSEDAETFTLGRQAAAPILVLPNGAPHPKLASEDDLNKVPDSGRPAAFFVGSSHMPNIEAAEFIVNVLAKECSEFDFHIVGSAADPLPSPLPANVVSWGVVSDGLKTAIASRSTVAINPMFSGGGSNVKVADYLANGLHVVSTEFGMRGYSSSVLEHATIADRTTFSESLRKTISSSELNSPKAQERRKQLFECDLSDVQMGTKFLKIVHEVIRPKKRVLAVTYRYTWPTLGGAEAHFLELLRSLGTSGEYSVDVVATEVSTILDAHRFHSTYAWDPSALAPIGIPNVRYMRFPIEEAPAPISENSPWHVQSLFEHHLYERGEFSIGTPGLLWGWHYPESWDHKAVRWASNFAGLYVPSEARVRIAGFSPSPCSVLVSGKYDRQLAFIQVVGEFSFEFSGEGTISLETSTTASTSTDPRCLAFAVRDISINDSPIDLSASPLAWRTASTDEASSFDRLHDAAIRSRVASGIGLTQSRGPHSVRLERYLEESISDYDLVISHNSVFRPAVTAMEIAKKASVASLLVGQLHLDDDYYHFPDIYESVVNASVTLTSPKASQVFLEQLGDAEVVYHTPGVPFHNVEQPLSGNLAALLPNEKPFLLVLGRKAGSKNYQLVVDTISSRADLQVVMIGPDDDGVLIRSPNVTYLGLQPRPIVIEALQKCLAVVNMSSSESFGMVLIEAWAEGKPVIANASCQAFRDIVVDGYNGFLVAPDSEAISGAIERLVRDEKARHMLGHNGRTTASKYSWEAITADFIKVVSRLTAQKNPK